MAYSGKVALITGAGSGMGQLAARNFAHAGAKVAALDVNEQGLQATIEGQANITPMVCDITDHAQVKAAVERTESELGPIDRVFNCAAIMPLGAILEQDMDQQNRLVDINIKGLLNVTNCALPLMLARNKGDYVSFASMAGHIPSLYTGVYSATKAFVAMFDEILNQEHLDSAVRFASVAPPVVNTPLLQQGKDTHWPKSLDNLGSLIEPQEVLDEIEKCLEKGQFMVTPAGGGIGLLVRRLFPGFVWKQMRKAEFK